MGVTYDTGALFAADRGERRMWARHRALLTLREVPVVPAPVVAQGWRGGSRQALLARLLVGCDVEALDDKQALGQHQRRPEATARRQLPEIDDQSPDSDDHGDEESCAEQAGVKEQKRAQEASSNSPTREMAPAVLTT